MQQYFSQVIEIKVLRSIDATLNSSSLVLFLGRYNQKFSHYQLAENAKNKIRLRIQKNHKVHFFGLVNMLRFVSYDLLQR